MGCAVSSTVSALKRVTHKSQNDKKKRIELYNKMNAPVLSLKPQMISSRNQTETEISSTIPFNSQPVTNMKSVTTLVVRTTPSNNQPVTTTGSENKIIAILESLTTALRIDLWICHKIVGGRFNNQRQTDETFSTRAT
jgi:hypothetical protein